MSIPYKKYSTALVYGFSLITACILGILTYYINYWPTDSENPYLPAAANLFNCHFLSEIHSLPYDGMLKLIMHGKEALILGIAIMQRILNDYQSLFPNVLLLIIAVGISGILLYLIIRKIFDAYTGLVAFILFSASFWPYLYILQGAHPPFALMNCLLAIFFLQQAGLRKTFYFSSGAFLGLMLFSSPTSVMYMPYYAAFFLYKEFAAPSSRGDIKQIASHSQWVFWGFLAVFLFFTLPNPLRSMEEFARFIEMSRHRNNLAIYRHYLSQFFPVPKSLRGGGLLWIIKYFFLIMPIMFSVYLVSAAYLLLASVKRPFIISVLLVCFSTPILVEASRVVQFGRNYFSWFIGIIFLICFALHDIGEKIQKPSLIKYKRIFIISVFLFLTGHVVFNARVFFGDVLPARMSTAYIYNWLIRNHTNELFVYRDHPRYKNMIQFFNNPKYENRVYFWPIDTIAEVKKGYIFIPTITGKTIWCECREKDFKNDPWLNKLFDSGEFKKYAVASFQTLSSSRIWTQEEEICTYRDLVVRDITDEDRQKGFAWILDAEKLQKEWLSKKTDQSIENRP